ncbi:hypothetical protein [Crossiella sp. NPDC003009]
MDDLGLAQQALQGIWDDTRLLVNQDLPAAAVTVGPSRKRHARCVRPTRVTPDNVQVIIDPKMIATGGEAAVAVMHAAVHALAEARGIAVLSSNQQHHLIAFLGVAEELGLVHPPSADDSTSLRFYEVVLGRVARARCREPLQVLSAKWPALHSGSPVTSSVSEPRRFRVLCPRCGKAAGRMSKKQFDDGPWVHQPCGAELVVDPRDIKPIDESS